MKRLSNADPLEDSKMSFGEHLEELRSALWKAVIALFLGFLVGLLLGNHFIEFVKAPLVETLNQLDQQRGENDYAQENGKASESDKHFTKEGYVRERFILDPQSLIETLRGVGVSIEPPEELPEQMDLWVWRPADQQQLIAIGVQDVFTVYIKASLVVGAVLASPFIFYFLWSFVGAGLYPHEKRYVHIFLPFSIGLFLLGATAAFYIVLKYVLVFLLGFNEWLGIEAMPRINEWLGFVLILPVMFGLAFQLPLVMLFLDRIGVVTTKMYVEYWRYAVLIIFILSTILTPADPQSLLAMAGFLTPLYFGGILLCKYLPKGQASFAERLDS
ncbi:Sec-independent protein translocase protein TatCy [Planctomycetes bacterium MalM25]|nr:Sec-independent protein translocase protein TatCy [Planctomycetes bacterium MalM25]